MKRRTFWVLLAIMTPILAMMIIQTGQAKRSTRNERVKRNILAMKQASALRDADRARQRNDALAPTRPRTTEELARLALKAPKTSKARLYRDMSAMAALARGVAPDVSKREDGPSKEALRAALRDAAIKNVGAQTAKPQAPAVIGSSDVVVNGPDDFGIGPTDFGFQSETAIDANAAGTVLVAGYNDLRSLIAGFSNADGDFSVSGVARSTDGGATWAEVTTDPDLPGLLPTHAGQVFGDPDVKWSPFLNGGAGGFIYSSIFVRNSDGVEGMCVNISDPNGANWSNPIQVPPTFRAGTSPGPEDDDIADKEFIDVNLVTGRILMSWTNFPGARAEDEGDNHDPLPHTERAQQNSDDAPEAPDAPAAAVQIFATYSNDGGHTWTLRPLIVGENVADPEGGVQSSVPRFLPGTTNDNSQAYIVFRLGNSDGTVNIAVNHSTNGGKSFRRQGVLIDTNYPGPDQIPGNDRINNSPGIDVDYTTGRVYVVYQRNDALGQGDIALRTFVGRPVVGTPILINSDPGNDRAQWYPDISVDQDTHFVNVNFLDQDPEDTGDLTESMNTYSEDDGMSWSPPTPILDRPFHAGYGNDSSEPNMGDYNQNVSFGGAIHSLTGATSLQPLFNECLDGGIPVMCTPDTYYDRRSEEDEVIPLRTTDNWVEPTEAGGCKNGFLDPGETINLTIPLENYDVNPNAEAETQTHVMATLTTTTAGVTIVNGTSSYPDITPGHRGLNNTPFSFKLGSGFLPGTFVDFVLTITSDQGHTQLQFRVATGTPGTTVQLIRQSFNSVTPPNLPPGWASLVGDCPSGATCDPWITSTARTPGNKAAFHSDTDGPPEWIRLASPTVAVPAASTSGGAYLRVDFDLNYSLEQDPSLLYQAFDGLFLRITRRNSAGTATIRSVGAEAFARLINTQGRYFYPKHLPRSNDPFYFADMSVWSGNSIDLDNNGDGTIHVSMIFPADDMGGNKIRLTFEYTQDDNTNCSGSGGNGVCGIAIDNVVLKHVQLKNGACAARQ
jgi:hypothetical protein